MCTVGEYWNSAVHLYCYTLGVGSLNKVLGCRIKSTRRIITGPNGCSNVGDSPSALQSANCLRYDAELEERRSILAETWMYQAHGPECEASAAKGDLRMCLGPLRLSRDDENSFTDMEFIYKHTKSQYEIHHLGFPRV